MTDNLVPAFQRIFGTSQSAAGFVQISFCGAYSVVALAAFSANVICLCAMSGFMSLMFPTIYGIGLGGIDPRAHKLGAAGLIMAIVGGALINKLVKAKERNDTL